MVWFAVVAGTVAIGAFIFSRINRPTVVATVTLLPTGGHGYFSPDGASAEDRIRLCLSYGSKVWWLLASEPPLARELFTEVVGECLDFWDSHGRRLLDKSPMAQEYISRLRTADSSATSGSVRISFAPAIPGKPGAVSKIWNSVHGPARHPLSIAWEFAILIDALYAGLNTQERKHAYAALRTWWDVVVAPGPSGSGFQEMLRLRASADSAWHARDRYLRTSSFR